MMKNGRVGLWLRMKIGFFGATFRISEEPKLGGSSGKRPGCLFRPFSMDDSKLHLSDSEKSLLDALRYFVGKIVEKQVAPKFPSHEFVSAITGLVYT
jgi:hypothetical protein